MNIGPESPKTTQFLGQSDGHAIATTACDLRIYAITRLAQIAVIRDHSMGAVVGKDFAAGCGKITLCAKTRSALRELAESQAETEIVPQAAAQLAQRAKTREPITNKPKKKRQKYTRRTILVTQGGGQ